MCLTIQCPCSEVANVRFNVRALRQNCQYNGTSVITWVGTELLSGDIYANTKTLCNQVTFILKPSKWQLWKIIDKPNIGFGNYVRHKNFALTLQLLHANNCLCCSLKLRTTNSAWKHLASTSMVTDNWICKRKLFLLCTYTKKQFQIEEINLNGILCFNNFFLNFRHTRWHWMLLVIITRRST